MTKVSLLSIQVKCQVFYQVKLLTVTAIHIVCLLFSKHFPRTSTSHFDGEQHYGQYDNDLPKFVRWNTKSLLSLVVP